MHNYVIRPAMPGDSDVVAAIAESAFSQYIAKMGQKPAPMLEDYAARIADGQVYVLVVNTGGEKSVCGFLVLKCVDSGMVLDTVAVAPEAQGHGYGKALIQFALEQAQLCSCESLTLYTNEAMVENIRLYTSLGFVETYRAVVNGFKRVYMSKTIL